MGIISEDELILRWKINNMISACFQPLNGDSWQQGQMRRGWEKHLKLPEMANVGKQADLGKMRDDLIAVAKQLEAERPTQIHLPWEQ